MRTYVAHSSAVSCSPFIGGGGGDQARSCVAHSTFVAQRKTMQLAGKMSSDTVVGGGSDYPPCDGQCSALALQSPSH